MLKNILVETEQKMHKAVEVVRVELSKIRSGKATTALLDNIKVDAYGTAMPLSQVGTVSVPDVHMLTVTPWDKSLISEIEKAIRNANLGFNPANDGIIVRIPIPQLNEERRKELVKLTKKFGEEGKISIRNIRRDGMEKLKKAEKDEHFGEDERKRGEHEVQKFTDKNIIDIDAILAHKEKEIMEV